MDVPSEIAARLYDRRSDHPSFLSRWLIRLGYRAEPSDVEIIISRYQQELDALESNQR